MFGFILTWQLLGLLVDLLDLRTANDARRLTAKISRAIEVDEKVIAIELLEPHIRVSEIGGVKTVRSRNPAAQAFADLFSLDSLQAVVALRDGWMPQIQFLDPLRWSKTHLGFGRLGLLVHPGLVAGLDLFLFDSVRQAILLGLTSFIIYAVSLVAVGTTISMQAAVRAQFSQAAKFYVARMGGVIEDRPNLGELAEFVSERANLGEIAKLDPWSA